MGGSTPRPRMPKIALLSVYPVPSDDLLASEYLTPRHLSSVLSHIHLTRISTMAPRKSKKKQAPRQSKGLEELANPSVPLLELSSEIRILTFSYVVVIERPFLIGRVQEDRGHTNGSPRDIFTFHQNSPYEVRRDDRRNRPKQPPISRVCRAFREESLPLW